MSAVGHGTVVLEWGDGAHSFRLGLREIGELEECRKAGLWSIFSRLREPSCFSGDVFDAIRLGLIGGGMTPVEALRKIGFYGETTPMEQSRGVALMIVAAAMARLPGDAASGEADAAGTTDGSTSPRSSEAPPPSV